MRPPSDLSVTWILRSRLGSSKALLRSDKACWTVLIFAINVASVPCIIPPVSWRSLRRIALPARRAACKALARRRMRASLKGAARLKRWAHNCLAFSHSQVLRRCHLLDRVPDVGFRPLPASRDRAFFSAGVGLRCNGGVATFAWPCHSFTWRTSSATTGLNSVAHRSLLFMSRCAEPISRFGTARQYFPSR